MTRSSAGNTSRSDQAHRVRPALAFLSMHRFVMNTAYRFVYPFLPAIARALGVPLEQAALLVSVRHLAGLGTPGVTRVLGRGDRRRRLIVTGLLLFTAGSVVTVLAGAYVGVLIGFAMVGIAKPVFDVSSQAYIADRVPYAQRARYLSVFEFTWATSLLIGAPAAGWLIAGTSWVAPFWAFAVLTAVGLLLVPRFIDHDGHRASPKGEIARFGRSGAAFLVVAGLFTSASEMIVVVFGAWLEASFGLTLIALGGVAALIGLSELVGEGATFAITDRLGKRRAVLVGLIVSIVAFLALAPAQNHLGIGLAVLAVGLFGFEFTIVSSVPLASELVPTARARFLAWMVVSMSVSRGVGAAVAPVLFATFGMPGPAVAAAIADAVAIWLLMVWVREAAPDVTPMSH